MSTPQPPEAMEDHRDALLRAAQSQLGDRFAGQIDASSIVQEVYLDLLQQNKSITNLPELRVRVQHKVVDAIRRLAALKRGSGQVIHAGQTAAPVDLPTTTPTPSQEAVVRESLAPLEEPTDLDIALVRAHYLEMLTYREIATRFNIPLGSVGDRIKRGLVKLRGQMSPRGEAHG